jgi:predicted O-methyltransferase YrrM
MADYGSHAQILESVLRSVRPKRVLEYGAGDHSTSIILAHPAVEVLVSYEPDQEWKQKVRDKHKGDERLRFTESKDHSPQNFDLVFIDDGTNENQRVETIEHVLSQAHPTVVIHDANNLHYAEVIGRLSDDYSIFPTDPDTAVVAPCES